MDQKKSGQVKGIPLYSNPVEDESLCCDKGILSKAFSTRKKYLIVQIRSQAKNCSVPEDQGKSCLAATCSTWASFFQRSVRGLWYHLVSFLATEAKRERDDTEQFLASNWYLWSDTSLTPVPGEVWQSHPASCSHSLQGPGISHISAKGGGASLLANICPLESFHA